MRAMWTSGRKKGIAGKKIVFLYREDITGNAYIRKIQVTTNPSKQANILRNVHVQLTK